MLESPRAPLKALKMLKEAILWSTVHAENLPPTLPPKSSLHSWQFQESSAFNLSLVAGKNSKNVSPRDD